MTPNKPKRPKKRRAVRKQKRFEDAIKYLRSEMRRTRRSSKGPRRDGESKDMYARRIVFGVMNSRAFTEAIHALSKADTRESK